MPSDPRSSAFFLNVQRLQIQCAVLNSASKCNLNSASCLLFHLSLKIGESFRSVTSPLKSSQPINRRASSRNFPIRGTSPLDSSQPSNPIATLSLSLRGRFLKRLGPKVAQFLAELDGVAWTNPLRSSSQSGAFDRPRPCGLRSSSWPPSSNSNAFDWPRPCGLRSSPRRGPCPCCGPSKFRVPIPSSNFPIQKCAATVFALKSWPLPIPDSRLQVLF